MISRDKTKQHCQHSFFGEGIVAHIAFADPICPGLRQLLIQAAQSMMWLIMIETYVNMEGPAFSTRAESVINQSWLGDWHDQSSRSQMRLERPKSLMRPWPWSPITMPGTRSRPRDSRTGH